jgi:hypothetical protein
VALYIKKIFKKLYKTIQLKKIGEKRRRGGGLPPLAKIK